MTNTIEWAESAIKLLKGPIYKNKEKRTVWNSLIDYKSAIADYFNIIGIRVHLDEVDGYAFLEQNQDRLEKGMEESEENDDIELPRLIRKQQLSFPQSMLLVLIRNELNKFDASSSESDVLILKKSEILDLYRSFSKELADESKLEKTVDQYIKTFVKLTFLFDVNGGAKESDIPENAEFEVSPIIKARITTAFMNEFLDKIKESSTSKSEELL